MSAALKQKASAPMMPTAFPTPERAALAHAIAAAADADARKAALAQAAQTADAEVRAARRAVEAADEAIEVAKTNAARHLTDTALGTAGAAPQSIRQARAAAIEAADHLEACLAAREALQSEQVDGHGLAALRVTDAARAVIKNEAAGRVAALAARVAEMQRQLVAAGSGLEWLLRSGACAAADENARRTVQRLMETTPNQWATIAARPGAEPFAQPIGELKWKAAFEALKRDAAAPLPEDDAVA